MTTLRTLAVSMLLSTALLTLCGRAGAAVVTVGSPLAGDFSQTSFGGGPNTWTATALAAPGANVSSPVDGVVIRWRMTGAYSGGPFRLRVLRPTGGGAYMGAGTSNPQTPVGAPTTNVFATNLPIKAGDLVGLDPEHSNDKIGTLTTNSALTTISYWDPGLVDGAEGRAPDNQFHPGNELGFNADVLPPPSISAIGPAGGSVIGGTNVTISGDNFAEVSGVSFGSVPASAFKVDSETQITATAPPNAALVSVPIVVSTLAGRASSASSFAYEGCTVPKLKTKKLKAAKKKIRAGHCKVGKVTKRKGATAKTGKVVKQQPKPGSTLAPGTKVKVTLGA
ncbi:MAG TPA: IPT/TIG domain-containing protein [Solirubrobacterales bacterium]|nr:IPT/TIG domain-containing protein [Solirubrobacterales bacterium]